MANTSPFVQGFVTDAFAKTFNEHGQVDPLKEPGVPLASSFGQPEPDNSFSQQFFGVNDPSDILETVGPSERDPNKILYRFKNDGKLYAAHKDKDPAQVLEDIWDHNSPGLWGAAKGSTLYGLPADFSSALAYGLDGLGLEDMSQEWRSYGDKLREEYNKNYGQFQVPGLDAAWEQGKLYDYALHTIGSMSPYLGLGLLGGGAGSMAAAGAGGSAALGSFVGAAGITAPVTIAQFADRQVAEMTEKGIENPYDNIDWTKAAVLGAVASGLQALPVQSILYSGPVLKALEKWGVKLGTSTSSRMLGAIADVAGTNALIGMGVSGLSRLNADLPLLDDEAKQEYLEAAVMGSLVGVPFGAYKGYKYRPSVTKPAVDPVETLKTSTDSELMQKYKAPDEDIIYGQAPEEQKLLPWRKQIIHNEHETYGINDVMDATEYLMNIKYKGKKGEDLDGYSTLLQHYANHEKAPTDREIIGAARKAKRVRELNHTITNTPDGILFPDIESQQQVHGHTPEILTKAAALTDQFGYDDAFVRNLSDSVVEKLHKLNIEKELKKNGGDKYPPQIYKQVLDQLTNFVDQQVVKDVEQYGSLYKRPEAQRRIGLSTEERRSLVNKNPRKELAEMLMRKRREEAGAKQYAAQEGVPREDVAPVFDGERPVHIFHGTSKSNAEKIKKSGKFDPKAGTRHYMYSDFGDFSSYFTKDSNSFWLDNETAADGLRAEYETVVKTYLKPSAKIFKISTFADAQRLAKMLGYTDEVTKPFTLYEEVIKKGTPGEADFFVDAQGRVDDRLVAPVSKPRLKDAVHQMMDDVNWNAHGTKAERVKMAALKDRLKALGIDAIDVAQGFYKSKEHDKRRAPYTNNLTDGQFIVFNHDIISPSLYKKTRTRPGDPPITTPTYKSRFIEEPPVEGEAFGPYAGIKTEPLGVRGLLPPPSPFKGMKVGDAVNITVNGAQVNPKPVKITKLVDDPKRGKFAFTEGSKSAVPIDNIELVQPNTGFFGVKPKTVVDALHKASTMPGERVTQKMSKKELLDFLTNSEWAKKVSEFHGIKTVDELKAVMKKSAALLKKYQKQAAEDKLYEGTSEGRQFRPEPRNKAKPKDEAFVIDDEVIKLVDEAKEAVRKVVAERNAAILKKHPELGPGLNDMFKRFAELEGESALLKDGPTTTVFKGKHSFVESVTNRLKVLRAMEEAFKHIDPKTGKIFVDAFNNMIVGKDTSLNDVNTVMSSLKIAFGLNAKDGLTDISDAAINNWYKTLREGLHPKTKEALERSRGFLDSYIEDKYGVQKKDLESMKSEDIEAEIFTNYLKGRLKVDLDKFNDSKQSKIFKQFKNSLKKAGKELNDLEYKSVDDLFEYNKASNGSIPRDARKPGAFPRAVEKELNNNQKQEKVQEDLSRAEQKASEDNAAVPPGGYTKPPKGMRSSKDPFINNVGNNIGNLQAGFAFFQSMPYLARKIPFVGKLHNIFKEQQDISASIDMAFARKFHEFFTKQANKDRTLLYEAVDIIDRARNTDQQLIKNAKGHLTLKDEKGVEVVFDKNMTDLIFAIDDYFKEGFRQNAKIDRSFLKDLFESEGLDENSSLGHINRVLEKFESKIRGNPLPELRAGYIRDRDALKELRDNIKMSEDIINSPNAYVPHIRLGDYVISVKRKGSDDILHFETISNTNIFGLEDGKLPSDRFVRQKIQELGLHNKFDPKDHTFDHFPLTYNNAAKYINRGLVSAELIQGLMASGLERQIKLADHLATGIDDPIKMMKDWSADVNSNKANILKYVLARGIGKHVTKSDNIPGYEKDWMKVIENYKNTFRSSLSRKAVAMKLAEAQKEMHLGRGAGSNLSVPARRISENYIDYMNTPATDYAGIRSFNFLWTMGYRISPALLQLVSLGTQIPALALESNPNLINVLSRMGSAMSKGRNYGRGLEGYSPEDQAFMLKHPYLFNESIANDFIEKEMSTSKLKGYGPAAEKAELYANKAIKNAGIFISAAETYTRRTAWSMYKNMYKEMPETLEAALKTERNNSDWQNFWETYKDTMPLEDAMAAYKMQLAHAVYGKTGRGPMQRGMAGAVLFPFMTYPQQMLELLFEQMTGKRGLNGVLAGLYTTSAYVGIAGLAGIPAYELLKTLYEKYEEKVNGRTIDLNMQLEHEGVPRWLRKGLVADATGVDISQRMAQDIIGQHILVGILKGDIKIGELGGVPGRTLGNLLEATGEALSPNSNKGPIELAAKVAPAFMADYLKAYKLQTGSGEDVLKTSSGKMIKDPADINSFDIATRALGFGTLEQTESRERLYYQQKANQEFNQWKSRLAEATATAKYKMHLGVLQGDDEKYREGREELTELSQELTRFARKNKIQLDSDFWNSYKKSVAERLWQKKNPGKIKKPTKREKVYLDILEE
jgi:hypothetical protein